jgi:uncharacterized integral membrane protein
MKRKTTFSFWGFIIVALLLVLFSVQNAQEVGFKFIIWKTHLSLSVLLIVAFLLGLIAGSIFSFRRNRSIKKAEKEKVSKKQPENLEKIAEKEFDEPNHES